jgi:hypothetical protein
MSCRRSDVQASIAASLKRRRHRQRRFRRLRSIAPIFLQKLRQRVAPLFVAVVHPSVVVVVVVVVQIVDAVQVLLLLLLVLTLLVFHVFLVDLLQLYHRLL